MAKLTNEELVNILNAADEEDMDVQLHCTGCGVDLPDDAADFLYGGAWEITDVYCPSCMAMYRKHQASMAEQAAARG